MNHSHTDLRSLTIDREALSKLGIGRADEHYLNIARILLLSSGVTR